MGIFCGTHNIVMNLNNVMSYRSDIKYHITIDIIFSVVYRPGTY